MFDTENETAGVIRVAVSSWPGLVRLVIVVVVITTAWLMVH